MLHYDSTASYPPGACEEEPAPCRCRTPTSASMPPLSLATRSGRSHLEASTPGHRPQSRGFAAKHSFGAAQYSPARHNHVRPRSQSAVHHAAPPVACRDRCSWFRRSQTPRGASTGRAAPHVCRLPRASGSPARMPHDERTCHETLRPGSPQPPETGFRRDPSLT